MLSAGQQRLLATPTSATLPADGRLHRLTALHLRFGALGPEELRQKGAQELELRRAGRQVELWQTAPVLPSGTRLEMRTEGGWWPSRQAQVRVRWILDTRDSFGDGTPDALRLHTAADRASFRQWMVLLAELENSRDPGTGSDSRAPEIQDCAGLLRFCYREALRRHSAEWRDLMQLQDTRLPPSVRQWSYPETPLGAGLFRVLSGPLQAGEFSPQSAAFAQFADAKTLWRQNTFFVSRDVSVAHPGDILFYRQLGHNSPYHSMIVTAERGEWVVYHTGPIGNSAGEIRRVETAELLKHPQPQWRPEPANANFLGVYRWNILREEP